MKNILIIGATSAIAQAVARTWAPQKASFFLVGRDNEKLKEVASDLAIRGASVVKTFEMDATHTSDHLPMLSSCIDNFAQLDIALIAHGTLPNQEECQVSAELALKEFENNGTSVVALLTLLSNHFERQRCGSIVVISSVAGDRGRPSNYLYGSAKAAISTFTEGLSSRLYKRGVHVMLVKPGFVDTPMTKHLTLPKSLLTSPEKVAQLINAGIAKKKTTIYTPRIWELIMLIIKIIPSFIFKKLNL